MYLSSALRPAVGQTGGVHPNLAPEGFERVPDDERYWTFGRIAATAIAASLVVFWLSIWGYALLSDEIDQNPDELKDQTYVARADAACLAAKQQIDALGSPLKVNSPDERADLLEKSNPLVAALVRQLNVIEVDNQPDRVLIDDWIVDWESYVADRERHVDRLRTEGDVRFLVTRVGASHVTVRIDGFARVNDMNNCEIPLDL